MPEACTSQNSQDFVGQVKSGKEDGPNEIGESSTDVCDKEEASERTPPSSRSTPLNGDFKGSPNSSLGVTRSLSEPSGPSPGCSISDFSKSGSPDEKETIEPLVHDGLPAPSPIHGGSRAQSAPASSASSQIPASDSVSSGSGPSGLEIVGTPSKLRDSQHSRAPSNLSLTPPQQNCHTGPASENLPLQTQQPQSMPLQSHLPPLSPTGPPQTRFQASQLSQPNLPTTEQESAAQHIKPEPLVQRTSQLLVAVPLQQTTNEVTGQPSQEETNVSESQVYSQQTQVYYQFPSVVTLPVSTSEGGQAHVMNASSQAQHISMGLQQTGMVSQPIQTVQHPQEQLMGMVGAIPVVKIQAPPLHFVKEKKGRFSLLHETPAVATAGSNTAQAPNVPVPSNIAVPTQSQSTTSSSSQLGGNVANTQTFDGTSAPTVKKKGRFMVTNVKNPGSIPMKIPPQQPGPPLAVESTVPQNQIHQSQQQPSLSPQPTPQSLSTGQQQVIHQSGSTDHQQGIQLIQQSQTQVQNAGQQTTTQQNHQQPVNHQAGTQPSQQSQAYAQNNNMSAIGVQEPTDTSIPTSIAVQQIPPPPQNIPEPPTVASYPAGGLSPQGRRNQQLPGNQYNSVEMAAQQQSQQIVTNSRTLTPVAIEASAAPTSETSKSTVSPTPGSTTVHTESIWQSQTVPVPKPPQSTERQKSVNGGITKKKQPLIRNGKMPQSIDRNGIWSSVGLGKVFYLLEQMKSEVTDADRVIKTLQTDMKLLRDKNKELEAKNRELERKLKEEKSLREKAEARNMDFRKRLRDAKSDASLPKITTVSSEDGADTRLRSDSAEKIAPIAGAKDSKQITLPKKQTPVAPPADATMVSTEQAKTKSTSRTGAKPSGIVRSPSSTKPIMQSSPKTIAKGISPRIDGVKREEENTRDSTPSHVRSSSFAEELEIKSLNPVQKDMSAAASPAKLHPAATQQRKIDSPGPSRSFPARPVPAGRSLSQVPAARQRCLSDFDPLRPRASTEPDVQNEVVPMISIPTPVSFEALPLETATPIIQNANETTRSADSITPVTAQFGQGTYVAENPFVVPIALGVAPAMNQSAKVGPPQQNLPNGFHGLQQQSFMVLPQQQPIMFQQVGTQIPNMMTNQWPQSLNNYQQGPLSQAQMNGFQTHSQVPQQQHPGSANPFETFKPDPFNDLLTHGPSK